MVQEWLSGVSGSVPRSADGLLELLAGLSTGEAAVAVVLVGIAIRMYFGDTLFAPKYVKVWNTVRSLAVPMLNLVAYERLGVQIENRANSDEFVGVVDGDEFTMRSLSKELSKDRSVEVPLLAGYKTDWEGRDEIGTLTSYHGGVAHAAIPNWLQPRQLHYTFFEDDDGDIVVTAHEEANSYRPDLWRDHLWKETFSAEKGVRMATNTFEDLEIDLK